MGNTMGLKRKKTAKIMKIDGTTFRFKTPIQANTVLKDHPNQDLLESEEVKRLGLRARPLHPDHPLQPGKLYFLIDLPRLMPDQKEGPPRRAWSGSLHLGAKDRLEMLKISRRSASDLTSVSKVGQDLDGGVRVRMRLPKAEVARAVEGSKDAAEAAERIMQLCIAREAAVNTDSKKVKKRTRFLPMPEEIIA